MKEGSAYWDRVVREGAGRSHYLDAFLGAMKRREHLALIERWGGTPAGGRVLKTDLFEEAMGPDAILVDLARGGLVLGVDNSSLAAGKARAHDVGARACYAVADVRRLPLASDSLALVFSPSTLDHFADPDDLGRSLREIVRVLQPGGRLIITLDNRDNVFDPLLRLASRLGFVPYFLGRSYTATELRAELEAAGLQVQDVSAILHNPRLVATGAVAVANRLGWPPLVHLVRRALEAAQAFGNTRFRFRTGSFVAACAIKPAQPGDGR